MVIVELLLEVVLVCVCDVLELRDLCIVRPFGVYPACFSLDLSKLVLVVSSHDVLVSETSADIGPSTLVVLPTRGLRISGAACVL